MSNIIVIPLLLLLACKLQHCDSVFFIDMNRGDQQKVAGRFITEKKRMEGVVGSFRALHSVMLSLLHTRQFLPPYIALLIYLISRLYINFNVAFIIFLHKLQQ